MYTTNISQRTCAQTPFNGSIIKGKNLRSLPESFLTTVSEIYEKKSGDLPDIVLDERSLYGEDGIYKRIDIIVGDDTYMTRGSISLPKRKFENMIRDLAPKKIAGILVNIAKRSVLMRSIEDGMSNLEKLNAEASMFNDNARMLVNRGDFVFAQRFANSADRIKSRIPELKSEILAARKSFSNKTKLLKNVPYISDYVY